ncbi:hypothetical protein PJ311_06305 [Bacillus sp. CLL-7-23]|uniref:Uncharacterized protein n=1 Tax=Bacillus changyiensis TaxID=3004103 RepID=A0ABT4X1Q7_9BACI|nr:hypothetical protein [Bacillus changyiensis]MDA7026225.1 hypothetical protein [Bacillus changyiensis]
MLTHEVVASTIYEKHEGFLEELDNPYCAQVFVQVTPTSYLIYRAKQGDHHG